ncbi:hypothetical protein BH10ACI1_BH10ACI1_15350 [soil metagenome]
MLKKNKVRENKTVKKENLSKSKRLVKYAKDFVFSPTFNVIALVVMLLSVFGGLRILRTRNVQAQVKFVESGGIQVSEDGKNENQNLPSPEIFKGEVYDTSIRLRETGALGMAISLAFFAETSEKGRVPKNLDTIWRFIQERSLMPPGLQIKDGEIISPTNIFQVRFQSQPFRFEILSRPNQTKTSPAILLRFPLQSMDGRTITYFQSASTKTFEMPAPFAPLEKIVSSGWTLEQWRGELLPKQENSLNLLAEEKRLLNEDGANR